VHPQSCGYELTFHHHPPVFRLIWLVGWLRPRTAIRRLTLLALIAVVLGAGTVGSPALVRSVVDRGEAALRDVVAAVTGLLPGGGGDAARVTHVVDGDTVDVSMKVDGRMDEVRVRLTGIDTPESKKPGTPVQCGALEAEHHLLRLTFTAPRDTDGDGLYDSEGGTGRRVTFARDSSGDDVDRYGRSLGYLSVRGSERTVQEQLLAAGWADVYVYRGRDFDRLDDFEKAARAAERRGRGVHALCGGEFGRPR
jgi:micrococcal nuclease